MFREPGLLLIDTTFFANITWWSVLPCSNDESFWNDGDGTLEMLGFTIDFRDIQNIKQQLQFKYRSEDKCIYLG